MTDDLITRRTFILTVGKSILLSLLVSRLGYLQLFKSKDFITLSDKNRISINPILPERGVIMDACRQIIVTSKSTFRIVVDKKQQPNLTLLFDLLDFADDERIEITKKVNKGLQVAIDNITWNQICAVEENLSNLQGVYIDTKNIREYLYNQSVSHLIGYTGLVNEEEQSALSLSSSKIAGFSIGKTGLEKFYDHSLRGEFGFKKIEVNVYGQKVRELQTTPSKKGDDLELNIRIDLQNKLYEYFQNKLGSCVVIDVNNGNIVALVSSPGFDLTEINNDKYWNAINNNASLPLINRAIQAVYPPGSIFKIVTVLAALESGISQDFIVECTGSELGVLNGKYFRCHSYHGRIDMRSAIQYSCNSYMYALAKKIGYEQIISTAYKLGLGERTNIDLPQESKGLLPNNSWKLMRFRKLWSLGDTLNLCIGQGFTLVTPVQLARMCACVANNGKIVTPTIKNGIQTSTLNTGINPDYYRVLRDGMYRAVNLLGGTAYGSRSQEIIVAGKTGTAQVQAKKGTQDLSSIIVPVAKRNHALFIGFAPFDNPRYAACAVLEHGGGGGKNAAPIGVDILLAACKLST